MISRKIEFLSIFISFICVRTLNAAYTFPEPTFEILSPKGFRVSIPDDSGLELFSFHGSLNEKLIEKQPGSFSGEILEPKLDKWTYENRRIGLTKGDIIYFWIYVQFNEEGYYLNNQTFTITEDIKQIKKEPPIVYQETLFGSNPNCERSTTRVRDQPTCKGEVIFEDEFNNMDWKKWSREIRIPLDTDDADFVSYQEGTKNCYVDNDILNIVPIPLPEFPGIQESYILSGTLDLASACTGIQKKECRRTGKGKRIIPPIVSAKIRTKESFSFKYGTIEVRAKLVKGDWLFPQIFLEPYTNQYGNIGYSSGQLRIAFIRANEILRDKNDVEIGGSRLYGGAVLATKPEFRENWLANTTINSKHFSDEFHVYKLKWTEESITLYVDDKEYGNIPGGFKDPERSAGIQHSRQWQKGQHMAPFDQEFYISLGISAGGVGDFPDDCTTGNAKTPKPWHNSDPLAEKSFYRDYNNWSKTWAAGQKTLQVDYVRVTAL